MFGYTFKVGVTEIGENSKHYLLLSSFLEIEEYYTFNNFVRKLAWNFNEAAKIFGMDRLWLYSLISLCPNQ